jgi:hypothetical protein
MFLVSNKYAHGAAVNISAILLFSGSIFPVRRRKMARTNGKLNVFVTTCRKFEAGKNQMATQIAFANLSR